MVNCMWQWPSPTIQLLLQVGEINTISIYLPIYLFVTSIVDSLLISKVPLCISANFNFHLDVSGDVDTAKFVDLLESIFLTQHFRSPKHIQGHILDWVITWILIILLKEDLSPIGIFLIIAVSLLPDHRLLWSTSASGNLRLQRIHRVK